ncbi:Transfer protein [Seminavis robusta]|uniref:Transfer protein n=1 Tax=Seminavis robusta TaxID=568900 RepID=A0A9N8F5D6_9STRA|nr:Transfer protein [Seminavis robusta]|eukprot:Sro3338_g346950.1 Transfer protein (539) ;mRNA; r:4070-5855
MEPFRPVADSDSSVPDTATAFSDMNTADNQEGCSLVASETPSSSEVDLVTRESGVQRDKTFQEAGLSLDRFPQSPDEADLVDKLLADEIEKLSLEEQEQNTFELFGMAQENKDPENIDELLERMELEIRKIPDRKAYEKAKYLNEEYVMDKDFRVIFLRSDEFDAKSAAQRFVQHFEVKRELFGDGPPLARNLLMSDLSEDDMKVLKSGAWQLLPERDAAGRLVLVQCPGYRDNSIAMHSHLRSQAYFVLSFLLTEDVQRKGRVLVVCLFGESLLNLQQHTLFFQLLGLKRIRSGGPRKVAGVHFLFSQEYLRPLVFGMQWLVQEHLRAKMRVHFGDFEQLKFKLQTFGIPMDCFPCHPNKPINLESHLQWIQSQRKQEEKGNKSAVDNIVPRRFDVLFGRGNTKNHTGNVRAGHISDMFREKYESAGKYEKTAIAERIVTIIQESHGRFLKWEDDVWVEVDQQAARNKISHFYRNTHKKGCPSKSKASSSSDGSVSGGSKGSDGESLASASTKRMSANAVQQSLQRVPKRCERLTGT